jgi:hypothetical protein
MLAGISQVDQLRNALVFKGGTALKKCYFGNYRFSEDLDFSCMVGAPNGPAMEEAVGQACSAAAAMLDEYAPVEIAWERYTQKRSPSGRTRGVHGTGTAPMASTTPHARDP